MASGEVAVLSDLEAVTRAGADRVVRASRSSVEREGPFSLVLSGGSTPRRLFSLLAEGPHGSAVPWEDTQVFWADERCVPPDDERSNFAAVRASGLLNRPVGAVHRIQGELPAPQAAAAYEEEIRASDVDKSADGDVPVFDFVLLGMGKDGHTASLFPGSPAVEVGDRWVTASQDPDGLDRVTLTVPVLVAAREVVFIVAGEEKTETVGRVIEDRDPGLPATMVFTAGRRVTWFLDEAAGAALQERRASWWR